MRLYKQTRVAYYDTLVCMEIPMLKMVLKDKEGKPPRTILLGLSHVNLDRLKQGYPIRFDSGDIELSPGTEFIIYCGKTEQSMADDMKEFIGPETKVFISPKLTK
jgi:hypothetical protein